MLIKSNGHFGIYSNIKVGINKTSREWRPFSVTEIKLSVSHWEEILKKKNKVTSNWAMFHLFPARNLGSCCTNSHEPEEHWGDIMLLAGTGINVKKKGLIFFQECTLIVDNESGNKSKKKNQL